MGVRGLVVMEGVDRAVAALGLPALAAAPLAEAMALASVDAFMYLHRLRFQPSTPAQARQEPPHRRSRKRSRSLGADHVSLARYNLR